MDNIPRDERPILFVGNHTIYGLFDMPLMIYEVRKQTGLALRGLAHPLHYMSAFGDLLSRYGAVKVQYANLPSPATTTTQTSIKHTTRVPSVPGGLAGVASVGVAGGP